MRILMLTQFYPPIIGGEERHVRNLSQALAERGHDVAVATLWHAGLAEYEVDAGVRVYRLRGTMQRASFLFSSDARRFAPPFPDPEVSLALRRVIRREQPEIVHAHNWLVHSYLPLKRWARVPLVVTLHNYNLACPTVTLMRNGAVCDGPALGKCLSCVRGHYGLAKGAPTVVSHALLSPVERRAVDLFVPVSRAVAEGNGLIDSGIPFEVVPNFIPDDVADTSGDVTSYTAALPDEPFLLYVGALSRAKGVDVLLRAYRQLHVTRPAAPALVLIGYPMSDTPELMAGLPEGAIALQDWPHQAVMHAWGRSLAGLVPSVWPDPCPTVALEAMAMGRPVIASRIGGLRDQIVDGETGLLTPAGDADALHAALTRLVDGADLRERMGGAARRHVASFRAGAVVTRIEANYERLARGYATAPAAKKLSGHAGALGGR